MRVVTPQVSWHNQKPVWSVDFSDDGNRLVTAGGDNEGNVWCVRDVSMILEREAIVKEMMGTKKMREDKAGEIAGSVEWLAGLGGSGACMNVARFAPGGVRIATGVDGGEIVVYELDERRSDDNLNRAGVAMTESTDEAKEKWTVLTTLRGHLEDVLDLDWSGDGSRLVSGSVDNTIFVWSVGKKGEGKCVATFKDHQNYVQGVTFDRLGGWIASQSTDRSLKIYRPSKKASANNAYSCVATVTGGPGEERRLFLNDRKLKGFFRRLEWSPEGSFVACPAGIHPGTSHYAVHLFARDHLAWPAIICSGLKEPAVAVRFSPVLYSERSCPNPSYISDKSKSAFFINFTYYMVFAVATADAILIYETQFCRRPIAHISGIHYEPITDLAWGIDGKTLAVSSIDGYVSIIDFVEGELGRPIEALPVERRRPQFSQGLPIVEKKSNDLGLPALAKSPASSLAGNKFLFPRDAIHSPMKTNKSISPTIVTPRRKSTIQEEPKKNVMVT